MFYMILLIFNIGRITSRSKQILKRKSSVWISVQNAFLSWFSQHEFLAELQTLYASGKEASNTKRFCSRFNPQNDTAKPAWKICWISIKTLSFEDMLDLFIKTVLHLGTFLKDSENVRSGPLNRTPWFQNSEIIIKKVNFANFPKLESWNEKE